MTLGHEFKARNRKEMTQSHIWEKRLWDINEKKTTQGSELTPLNGKEITLGQRWEKWL